MWTCPAWCHPASPGTTRTHSLAHTRRASGAIARHEFIFFRGRARGGDFVIFIYNSPPPPTVWLYNHVNRPRTGPKPHTRHVNDRPCVSVTHGQLTSRSATRWVPVWAPTATDLRRSRAASSVRRGPPPPHLRSAATRSVCSGGRISRNRRFGAFYSSYSSSSSSRRRRPCPPRRSRRPSRSSPGCRPRCRRLP